jgi:hypothetical protein
MAGYSEHYNKSSGSIEDGRFLTCYTTVSFSRRAPIRGVSLVSKILQELVLQPCRYARIKIVDLTSE